jgi:uncharacterized protein YlaN (UPF0358 family)
VIVGVAGDLRVVEEVIDVQALGLQDDEELRLRFEVVVQPDGYVYSV